MESWGALFQKPRSRPSVYNGHGQPMCVRGGRGGGGGGVGGLVSRVNVPFPQPSWSCLLSFEVSTSIDVFNW